MTIMQNLVEAIFGPVRHGTLPKPPTQPQPLHVILAEKALDDRARQHPDLHWRTSIVDLLKLVGQDSSLPAREKLATELGYPGKGTGEPAMNEFLHKHVLERLGIK